MTFRFWEMCRIIFVVFVAGLGVTLGVNTCQDPGSVARSDRKVFGKTAPFHPDDIIIYICRYGDKDALKRWHHLKCLENGKWNRRRPTCPLTEWERCKTTGCNCDKRRKTITCSGSRFPHKARLFPSDTVRLTLRKTGKITPTDFPHGMFANLKQLKELHVASTNRIGIFSFSLGYLLPIKGLQKFTFFGEGTPNLDFGYIYDKKSKCDKTNCYATCGEPTLLNPRNGIRNVDEKRTLYAFWFNGDQLHGLKGDTTVHTFTFYHTKRLFVPKGARWTIIAREFVMSMSDPVTFDKKSGYDCSLYLQSPGKHGGEKLILLKQGPLTIYAERIKEPGGVRAVPHSKMRHRVKYIPGTVCRYHEGEPTDPPRPSVDLSRAATICAVNLAYPDPDDSAGTKRWKRDVGMAMFDYLVKILSVPTSRALPGAEVALSQTMQARERLVYLQQNSARYVPFLSKDLYETLLDELYRAGDVYRTHMYKIEKRVTDVNDTIKSTQLMVHTSADLVSAAKIAHKNAVDVLTVSEKSMARIKKKFFAADAQLAELKKTFEAGIREYTAKQAMNMFFAILRGIGSIIKGVFAGGAGIGDIMVGIATIGETITKIVLLIKRIKTMMESNERLMKTAKSMRGSDSDVTDYVTDLDGAADLRLQIVYWDNMVYEVEQLLGKGDVATIRGCAHYRLGLSSLAAWGKALTEETIRQTTLVRDSLQKKEILRGLEAENDRLTVSIDNSQKEHKINEDIFAGLYFQAASIKMTLTETLREYCLSYFYYQLGECSPMVRPKLSDSMFQLLQKVSMAKIEALNSLANLKGLPQPFQGIVVELTDKQGDNCTKIENCPVSTFKKKRELLLDIHTNHKAFAILQRVKLEEITIELVGATTVYNDSKIFLMLETSGDFRDMWGSTMYNFTSAPFVKGFAYKPFTGEIIYRGMVHDNFAAFFIETSPFTTWRLTMPHELDGKVEVNTHADISNVTAIKLHFSGSAIPKPIVNNSARK